jgi:NitT/TauT family transport system ATP-binding protein
VRGLKVKAVDPSDRHQEATRKPKIEFRGVGKHFVRRGRDPLRVLGSIDVSIADQSFVSIIGPSGSGKSTLLFLIAGLLKATCGEVLVEGKRVQGPGRDRGVVFQEDAIFPWRTVRRNVAYGLELQGVPAREREERVKRYLELVRLEAFEDLYPSQLSGGMKKRVAIAEVLANEPDVLLLDEPFGALDYVTKIALQEELARIWQSSRLTTVLVTHDIEEALFLSDRILVLRKANLVLDLPVPFERPRRHEVRNDPVFAELKERLWREIGGAKAADGPPGDSP